MLRHVEIIALALLMGGLLSFSPVQAEQSVKSLLDKAADLKSGLRSAESERNDYREAAKVLSEEISRLKSEDAGKGKVLTNPTLVYDLKESAKLTEILDELEVRITKMRRELSDLYSETDKRLGGEISKLMESWRSEKDRDRKVKMLDEILRLKAERNRIRVTAGNAASGSKDADMEAIEIDPLDGPVELREKADVIEDHADTLTKRIAALDRRISEIREEREFREQMSDFLGEKQLFDEQDRVVRAKGMGSSMGTAAPGGGKENPQPPAPKAEGDDRNEDIVPLSGGGYEGEAAPSSEDADMEGDGWNAPDESHGTGEPALTGAIDQKGSVRGDYFDPSEHSRTSAGFSDTGLKHSVEELSKQTEAMRRKAKDLKDRAEKMRLKAEEMERGGE